MQKDDQLKHKKIMDIDQLIKNRKSRLLKMLPSFLVNCIKRIACQEDINSLVGRSSDKYSIDFVRSILKDFNVTFKTVGEENIKANERYVFVSNHPLGGIDGMVLIDAVWSKIGETHAVINDLLLNVTNFKPIFLGVNTFGRSSREKVQIFDNAFASNKQIIIFPAGLVSRKESKKIEDVKWKKTFVTKAIQHKRTIIPVHIDEKLSNSFYNVAKFRKFIGIKANIELFLLPREFFKQQNREIVIHFGKPITYDKLDRSRTQDEWAQEIKRISYTLIDK